VASASGHVQHRVACGRVDAGKVRSPLQATKQYKIQIQENLLVIKTKTKQKYHQRAAEEGLYAAKIIPFFFLQFYFQGKGKTMYARQTPLGDISPVEAAAPCQGVRSPQPSSAANRPLHSANASFNEMQRERERLTVGLTLSPSSRRQNKR
jgi:hypothetical protein